MEEEQSPVDPDEGLSPSPADRPRPKNIREIATEFWRGNSSARSADASRPVKEIVNGLDHRETVLGFVATVVSLGFTVVAYLVERHSANHTLRTDAGYFLLTGIIVTVLLGLGTGFRRRALLGFAALLTGLELLSNVGVFGLLYLAFGAWLIMRVMRKQKIDRANHIARPARKPAKAVPAVPAASKRYTPPRRAKSGSRRR